MEENEVAGRIFNIQRYCVEDGPGIRTTVFFQGCPLHCPWCHNPESRPFVPLVSCKFEQCIGCGRCNPGGGEGRSCRRDILKSCNGCGVCVEECPAGALTLLGRLTTVHEVLKEVEKDRFYYDRTSGGMTLSGGEPLAQPDFAYELAMEATRRKIGCAIETSGALEEEVFRRFLNLDVLWLFDIKAGEVDYSRLIGVPWERVYRNLLLLAEHRQRIWLRVPVVMDWNASEDLLTLLQQLVLLKGVEKVDLLPFHPMGDGKAAMAGLPESDWSTMKSPDAEFLERWRRLLAIK